MASTKEYLDFVLEQLSELDEVNALNKKEGIYTKVDLGNKKAVHWQDAPQWEQRFWRKVSLILCLQQ